MTAALLAFQNFLVLKVKWSMELDLYSHYSASTLIVKTFFSGHQAGGAVADSEEDGGCRRLSVTERRLNAN